MPNSENEKAAAVENNLLIDLCPPTPSPEHLAMENDTNAPVMTRFQSHKRKPGNLAKNCFNRQSALLNPAIN